MNQFNLTKEGFDNLKKELAELVEQKKPKAIERLQKARSMGDLSENSEYTAAREDLNFIEQRIAELEEIIKNAKIVGKGINKHQVELGETVILESAGQRISYQIVGEYEADPSKGKISANSPIGQAILGKMVGDLVEVKAPVGKIKYRIVEIKEN